MVFEALQKIPEDMLDKATHLNGLVPFIIHTKIKMTINNKINMKKSPAHKELEDCVKKKTTQGACLRSNIVDIM